MKLKAVVTSIIALVCSNFILQAQDLENGYDPKHPVTFAGSVDLRGIAYQADGIQPRRSPFSYMLNAAAQLNVYGVALPFSLTYTDQQNNLQQPFNQFGISPKYKWIQLHLGYRNIVFSPYTLAGYTMLGAGIELTPGKFRFGFMYGRLNKATAIDTTNGAIKPYSFSRTGYAVKVGYGTDERNFELSYLTAKDDTTSVNKNIPDSLKTVHPEANAVLSLRFIYTFAKRLFIEADGGASIYTNNLTSNYDTLQALTDANVYLKDIVHVNVTTQVNLAYTGSIGYKAKKWSLKATYRHIDPEFKSMGAYFFQNDVDNYTLATAINAFKNKVRFAGSFGIQNDNVRQQKTATTTRQIGSASLSWEITQKLGIDASYINFSATATPKVVSVNNKYMLAQTTGNTSVTPRFVSANENYTHVIIASYNSSTLQDHNAETSTQNNINTNVIFLNYSITQNKTALTLTAGVNHATTTFSTGTVSTYGASASANKALLKNKLQLCVNASYSRTDQSGAASVINAGCYASYDFVKHNRISLKYYALNNKPDIITTNNVAFTEHTTEIAYTLTF